MRKPSLSRSKKVKYKRGFFNVNESTKYISTGEAPQYRSSYEYIFMVYCERSPKIIKWTSEPFSITYFDITTNRNRQYFIDFVCDIQNEKYSWWVEVKPSQEVDRINKFKKSYESSKTIEEQKRLCAKYPREAKNYAKWIVAEVEAKKNNAVFKIITEKFLFQI